MNYIVETRNEYTTQLVNILSPQLFEGFDSIYNETEKLIKKNGIDRKKLLKTFQQFIKQIPTWNNSLIELEVNRIITASRCDFLLDLIKAVIKSNIILLSTNNLSNKKISVNEEYLNINLNNFIHKCYIECARQFYSIPYLYSSNFKPLEKKKNYNECLIIIQDCIKETIRKNLPVHDILKQYLGNDLLSKNGNELDYESESFKKEAIKKIGEFINSEVIENFKEDNEISSEDCINDDETLNLVNDMRKKYFNGSLVENKSTISNNIDNKDVTRVFSNDSSEEYVDNIANNPSVSERYKKSGTTINENLNTEVKSVKVEDSDSKLNNSSKSNIVSVNYTNEKSENNIVDSEISNNNKSISYKVEQDSEYEAVFSNVNDDFNDIVGKKKRKDEYFSKFNNI